MAQEVVVVTGAGRGIGRAVCLRFAREGAHVVAAARSTDQLAQTRDQVNAAGGQCTLVPTDVGSPDEVAHLIEEAQGAVGRIDVLVNAAGVAPLAAIEEFEASVFESVFDVNMAAIFHAAKAVWPIMRRQGGGAIVSISSVAAIDPFPGFAVYGASKAWVNAMTQALANEGRPHGIRVFSIAPGAVETQMLRDAFPDFPAGQALQPAEVAELVYTVSRPNHACATGQTLYIRR